MTIKILKNTTSSPIFINDVGISISNLHYYQIPIQDDALWASSNDIITNIVNNNIVVNDGSYDLLPRIGIGLIQNNVQILTEYYTLVQDDSVLIGNGQILQLYDEFWELESTGEEYDFSAEVF